jgi:hypothetical protein
MRRMAWADLTTEIAGIALGIIALVVATGLALSPAAEAAPSVTPLGMSDSYGLKISALDTDRPTLLKGLMAPDPRSDAAFRERLSAQFKGTIKEASLTDALTKQGFKVSANADEAYFSESIYPCLYLWRITWDEDAEHNIHRLSGRTRSSCA